MSNINTFVNLKIDLLGCFCSDHDINEYKKKYGKKYWAHFLKDFTKWISMEDLHKKNKEQDEELKSAVEYCQNKYGENEQLFKACIKKRIMKKFTEFETVETNWK